MGDLAWGMQWNALTFEKTQLLTIIFRPIFLSQLFAADDISGVIFSIKSMLQRSELFFFIIIT